MALAIFKVMVKVIEAVYENGVFKPLKRMDLKGGDES